MKKSMKSKARAAFRAALKAKTTSQKRGLIKRAALYYAIEALK